MRTVPASAVAKNFGEYHDAALAAPVAVTKHGRTSVVMLSFEEFSRLTGLAAQTVQLSNVNPQQTSAEAMRQYSVGMLPLAEAMIMTGIDEYVDFVDAYNASGLPWPSRRASEIEAEAAIVHSAIEGSWGPDGEPYAAG